MKISISQSDNFHLHHLIFKFINNKFKNSLNNNSATGLIINIFNFLSLSIATIVSNHSFYLSLILIFNILTYLLLYFYIFKKLNSSY